MGLVSVKIVNQVGCTPGIKPDFRRDVGRQYEPLQGLAAIRARDFHLHPLRLAQLPQSAVAHGEAQPQKICIRGPVRRSQINRRTAFGYRVGLGGQSEDCACIEIRETRESSLCSPKTPGLSCCSER